jgi:hypothetical protein
MKTKRTKTKMKTNRVWMRICSDFSTSFEASCIAFAFMDRYSFPRAYVRMNTACSEILPNLFVGSEKNAIEAEADPFDLVVNCTPNVSFYGNKQMHDDEEAYMTLVEMVRVSAPLATTAMRACIAKQMAGRWRHVVSQQQQKNQMRTIRNHRDRCVTLSALPASVAYELVQAWLPWAVNKLREEVTELAQQLNITEEAIAAGEQAPELSDGSEEDLF